MTERDLRQLLLVIRNLQLFQKQKIDEFTLSANLSGLLSQMECKDDWVEAAEAEVNELDCRAYLEKDVIVDDLIEGLKSLTDSALTNYLQAPDPKVEASATAEPPDWLICSKCYEAWQSTSDFAMVICPKCESALHNPRALA